MRKIVTNEDGQVLVLFALLLVVLMGFAALAVDVGSMTLTRAKLQSAADAAALAGAQDLPDDSDAAESTAVTYAGKNGVQESETIATAGYDGDPNKIKVVCTRTVQHSFARALGFKQTDISAYAIAQGGGISGGVSGLRPWALTDSYTYTYGLEFVLKKGGGGGSNGYFGIVSFGTQGGDAKTYKGNIEDGYNGIVKLGNYINDASGNKNVKKDINALMDKSGDTSKDYTKAEEGNSRVVLVPKIDSNFKVIGFAVLYLVSVDNQGYITANFLYDTTWSEEEQAAHYDWGLNSGVKLIE